MKKTSLLISFLFFVLSVFGQAQKMNMAPLYKSLPASPVEKAAPTFNKTNAVQSIWSDDFSNSSNWKITHDAFTAGDWVIGSQPPSGLAKLSPINSSSKAPFALFDSDLLCGGNQIAHLTTVNAIDLSAHPFVKLSFEQVYRRFYDTTFVSVSTDNINWIKYEINGNYQSAGHTSPNPETVEVDISSAAGGKSTVWIRFTFYSPKNPGAGPNPFGCAYSWQIDDVSLSDLQNNDLVLNATFMNMAGSGYYGQMPASQVDSVRFKSIISNKGAKTQTNVALNVGIVESGNSLYNYSSPALSIPYSKGAIMSLDDPAFPIPSISGKDYKVTFTATQNETDSFPSDNVSKESFFVSENVYARDNGDLLNAGITSPGFYMGGDANESVIGNLYSIQTTEQFGSISVYIDKSTTKKKNLFIRGMIYQVTPGATSTDMPVFDLIAASNDSIVVDSTKFSTWMTLPLVGKVILDKGAIYLAGIEVSGVTHYNDQTGGDQVITAADNTSGQFLTVSFMYAADSSKWRPLYEAPFIRLNTLSFSKVEEIQTGISSLTNCPNPFNKTTTISYELANPSEVKFEVYDITGRKLMTINEGFKNAGKNTTLLNASGFSKGIYFYTLKANGQSVTKRMVVID